MHKHFYAGRMVEFSVLYKTNVESTDVLRCDILPQPPSERPTENLIAVSFKKASDGLKILTISERDCRIFSRKMARQRQGLQPEITVLGDGCLTGRNEIGKSRSIRHSVFRCQISAGRGQKPEVRGQRSEIMNCLLSSVICYLLSVFCFLCSSISLRISGAISYPSSTALSACSAARSYASFSR